MEQFNLKIHRRSTKVVSVILSAAQLTWFQLQAVTQLLISSCFSSQQLLCSLLISNVNTEQVSLLKVRPGETHIRIYDSSTYVMVAVSLWTSLDRPGELAASGGGCVNRWLYEAANRRRNQRGTQDEEWNSPEPTWCNYRGEVKVGGNAFQSFLFLLHLPIAIASLLRKPVEITVTWGSKPALTPAIAWLQDENPSPAHKKSFFRIWFSIVQSHLGKAIGHNCEITINFTVRLQCNN